MNTFPVFNDPEESVLAIKMLWDHSRKKIFKQKSKNDEQSSIQFKKNGDITNMSPGNVGMNLIEKVMIKGRTTLSEYESKQFLASHQIPIAQEMQVTNEAQLLHLNQHPWLLPGIVLQNFY